MNKKLSVFAGEGELVPAILKSASDDGWQIQLLNLSARRDLNGWAPMPVNLSNPLSILMKLRSFAPSHICMVGGLKISDKQREGLAGFLRNKSKRQRTTGDTGMSRLIGALEFATGAKVIGVHEIVPDLKAEEGLLAGPKLTRQVLQDCAYTLQIAKKVGELDIGQAAVCVGNRIIGVEDIAGTDALLARVASFVKEGMTGNSSDPLILGKAKKPDQPDTTDLPAIGPDTIRRAKEAGVAVVCVEAGHSLLIGKSELFELANRYGISVVGVGEI